MPPQSDQRLWVCSLADCNVFRHRCCARCPRLAAARRGEGQITANERWSLFSELELSFFRSKPRNLEFSKKLVNGLFATHERSTANVDYRVWLEQRRHARNISSVLSRYQQSLQILRIVGRLSCR